MPGSTADQIAQAHGFPDAATMMAWSNNRSAALHNGQGGTSPQSGDGGGQGISLLGANGKWQGPVGGMFQWLANKYQQATGQ